MSRQLYTYSMVSAFFNRGSDYIDSFWPFVICSFAPPERRLSIEELQNAVSEKTGLIIPIHSLTTILTRAKRQNYVHLSGRTYGLTDKGLHFIEKLEPESDVQRRINSYVDDLRQYLSSEAGIVLTLEETAERLTRFIGDNVEYFLRFVLPNVSDSPIDRVAPQNGDMETGIIKHFIDVEKRKPELFSIVREIIFGSTISNLMQSDSFRDANRHMEKTTVVLDTNLAFSLLGLHYREFNLPAQELHSLLKREGCFSLSIFDFTIQEMIRVLGRYSRNERYYFTGIKVGSIYSSLKSQGWTLARIAGLITRIEDRLGSLGIKVITTGINLDKTTLDPEEGSVLARYKDQAPWNQLHDISAIKHIRILRAQMVRRIEKAKYLFLTSDIRLANYNYIEWGHRADNTICEVIPDKLLANLLWLKNPEVHSDVPLRTIIAMHSRDLFIDRKLWEGFFATVGELRTQDKINDQDVAVLLYDQQINGLLTHGHGGPDVSKADWVLARLEEAKKRLDAQKSHDLEEAADKVRKQMEGQIPQVEQRAQRARDDEMLEKIDQLKAEMAQSAGRLAKQITNGIGVASLLLVLAIIYFLLNLTASRLSALAPYLTLIQIAIPFIVFILVGLGWIKTPLVFRHNLEKFFSNRIYKIKLRRSKIDVLVANLFGN